MQCGFSCDSWLFFFFNVVVISLSVLPYTWSGTTERAGVGPDWNGGRGKLQISDQTKCRVEGWLGRGGWLDSFTEEKLQALPIVRPALASRCGSWPAAVWCSYGVPTPLDMYCWLQADCSHGPSSAKGHSLPGQMLSQLLQWLNTFLVFGGKERKMTWGSLDLL